MVAIVLLVAIVIVIVVIVLIVIVIVVVIVVIVIVVRGNYFVLVYDKTGQVRLMHQQPLRQSLRTLLHNTEALQLVLFG